MLVCSWRGTKM